MAQRIGKLVMKPRVEVDAILHLVDSYKAEYSFVAKRKSETAPSAPLSKKSRAEGRFEAWESKRKRRSFSFEENLRIDW